MIKYFYVGVNEDHGIEWLSALDCMVHQMFSIPFDTNDTYNHNADS